MSEQPITDLETAVRVLGALPMPAGPAPQEPQRTRTMLDHARDALTARMSKDDLRLVLENVVTYAAELEKQRDRRRARLVALQNDALNIRGALSPNGKARKVPMPLGETLLPAVEWLINRVAELEAERHTTNEVLDDVVQELRWLRPRTAEQLPVDGKAEDDVTPQVRRLRSLLAGQREAVDGEHYASVHHPYRLGRDLPPLGGVS